MCGSFEKSLRSFSQLKAPRRCLLASSNGGFKKRLLSPQQSSIKPTCVCLCVRLPFTHARAWEELCCGWLWWGSSEHFSSALSSSVSLWQNCPAEGHCPDTPVGRVCPGGMGLSVPGLPSGHNPGSLCNTNVRVFLVFYFTDSYFYSHNWKWTCQVLKYDFPSNVF